MTREETKMIIGMLGAVYSSEFDRKTDEQINTMIDVWTMLFEDEDANKIANATKAYLKSNSNAFMPTPAMLIEKAYNMFEPKGMTEQQAWNHISRAIRNGNYHAREEWENLPKEVQEMCSVQDIRDWAGMDTDKVQTVVASNWQRSFKVREKARQEYNRLPNATKDLIESLGTQMKLEDK